MLSPIEFLALAAFLAYNGWQLNEIRKVSRACYVELNTTRWENGKRSGLVAENQDERLSAIGGKL